MAYSYLSYGVVLWGAASECSRAFVLQKRILRLIYGLGSKESCVRIFKQYDILTFPGIVLYKCAIYAFKMRGRWSQLRDYHSYRTRHGELPRYATASFERSPENMCKKVFNGLPISMRQCSQEEVFKRKLKCYLVEKCYYSLSDFFEQ